VGERRDNITNREASVALADSMDKTSRVRAGNVVRVPYLRIGCIQLVEFEAKATV
jgi:hypothetical protein